MQLIGTKRHSFFIRPTKKKVEIITLTQRKAFKGVVVGRNWIKKKYSERFEEERERKRKSRDVKVVSFITNVIFWLQLGKLFNRYEGNWIFCSNEVFFKYSV